MVIRVLPIGPTSACGRFGPTRSLHGAGIVSPHQNQFAARARRVSTQHLRPCTSGIHSIDITGLCTREGRVGAPLRGHPALAIAIRQSPHPTRVHHVDCTTLMSQHHLHHVDESAPTAPHCL